MNYLVLSSSLDPGSRSRVLARAAHECLVERRAAERVAAEAAAAGSQLAIDAVWLDAAALQLPLCDGGAAWDHPDATRVASAIETAYGIVFALGVYNFGASAVAKTLVELGASAWSEKIVGFLCASGGPSSYMAVMGLANSLMLDFRCIIVPRFVFATASAFRGDEIEPKVRERIRAQVDDMVRMTGALRGDV